MSVPVNGSQRLLQLAVNRRPELLLSALRKCGATGRREQLRWVSPLVKENHCEYRDGAALEKLGLAQHIRKPLCGVLARPGLRLGRTRHRRRITANSDRSQGAHSGSRIWWHARITEVSSSD